MSWWNDLGKTLGNVEQGVAGIFHRRPSVSATAPVPQDPEAPIKSFMRNAPQTTGNPQIDENMKLKRELLDGTFKKGGKVNKTGVYKLHKGERVLNKKEEMSRKMCHGTIKLTPRNRKLLSEM